jgi:exopolysaccharide production protein ExoQ
MTAGNNIARSGMPSALRIDNGHVLGAAAFAAPIIGVFAPLGLAPLLAVTAIAALAITRLRQDAWLTFPRSFAALLAIAAVWGLVTLLWAPNPRFAAAKLGELALMFTATVLVLGSAMNLGGAQQKRTESWMLIGFALALALLLLELVAGFPIRRIERSDWPGPLHLMLSFDRGVSVLAIFVWPAARALWRRSSLAAIILWLATAALVGVFSSATAKAALAVGLIAFLAARIAPRAAAGAVAAIVAVTIVAAPFAAERIPAAGTLQQQWPFNAESLTAGKNAVRSGLHRLVIWQFTAERIAEKPLLGWGFDASRWLPGGKTAVMGEYPALPLHPHSAPLQWWVELGVLGALLGAAVALMTGGALRRIPDRRSAATGVALFASAATVGCMSFGVWQSWWIGALALAAAFHVAATRGDTAHK